MGVLFKVDAVVSGRPYSLFGELGVIVGLVEIRMVVHEFFVYGGL